MQRGVVVDPFDDSDFDYEAHGWARPNVTRNSTEHKALLQRRKEQAAKLCLEKKIGIEFFYCRCR